MTRKQIAEQCQFVLDTLDTGCVECDKKSKDFYRSVLEIVGSPDEKIKLSELVAFVHKMGNWQTENCYQTKITKVHNSLVISNQFTYGDTETAHDSILVSLNKKGDMCKVDDVSVEQPYGLNDERVRKLYDKLIRTGAFDDYVVEVDCDIS